MNKDIVISALKNRQVRDYTYAIMFFVVSSFFAFFVIRPVLSIAISIQREATDLEQINAVYEKNITKVLELQSQIEQVRPRKFLIDEALPSQPRIDAVIADVQRAGVLTNTPIDSININPISIKSPEEDLSEEDTVVEAIIQVSSSYQNIEAFLRAIANQRRVKSIRKFDMILSSGPEESTILSLDLELDSYYLSNIVAEE